jgi:hypothetical protein
MQPAGTPWASRRTTGRVVLAIPLALALGGCFLIPWSPDRPDPKSVSGPAVYAERCETCHAAPVGEQYAHSLHAAQGIRCGQCHTGGGHPEFAQPIGDAKCGGCHQAQYEQTLASKHFAMRLQRPLDGDRTARIALRREQFIGSTPAGRAFVGDVAAGKLGGRLCAACHYDEHRLGLGTVRQTEACSGCHTGRETHFPDTSPAPANRCVDCHVRVGKTPNGQTVNTHRFAPPGTEGGP